MFRHHHRHARSGGGCGHHAGRDGHERGFGRGWGGPSGWSGRRGGRPFEQGDLKNLVMSLLGEQPRHGYEIIKAIEDAMGGHYSPSPGVIYPTLTLLEETGLIGGEAQGAKKLYSLTDAGRGWLEERAGEVRASRERLEAARARFGGGPRPEVMRAMGNLAAALQVRMGRGELTDEALGRITAAIDKAAGEVERS